MAMIDHLINVNDLMKDFEKFELDKNDITFIKELIDGPQDENKVT